MEDATSEIYSAFLVDQEGTASSLRGVREVVAKHGLFCSLYTDRGSHYFFTPEGGGKVSKTVLTQVGRALKQLGIEHIAAYSPQARGRSERVFGTLQDRLPKELKLAGIDTVEAANRWLAEATSRTYNKRFAIDRRAGGFGVCGRCHGCLAGDPVHPGGSHGRQRQHGEVGTAAPATAAEPAATRTSSRQRSGCMSIRMASWRCSGGRTAGRLWHGRRFGSAGSRPCCGHHAE